MLIGAYGAALIGFVTTAVPEWTDTPRPQKNPLLALAFLWGIGRCVGILGFDAVGCYGCLSRSERKLRLASASSATKPIPVPSGVLLRRQARRSDFGFISGRTKTALTSKC
jgi:hypothetical protein